MTSTTALTALRDQVEAHIRDLREVKSALDQEADKIHHKGVMIRWASFGLAFAAFALSAVAGATGLGDIWSATTIAVLSLAAALVVAINTAITATSRAALTRRYKMLGSALGYDARIEARIDKSEDELSSIGWQASPQDQKRRLVLLEHDTDVALDSARKFVNKLHTNNAQADLEAIELAVKQ
jgi:hypothetical protein